MVANLETSGPQSCFSGSLLERASVVKFPLPMGAGSPFVGGQAAPLEGRVSDAISSAIAELESQQGVCKRQVRDIWDV